MDKINELVSFRADKLDALEKLVEKMGASDYVENDVDQEVYEELKKDIANLESQITRANDVIKLKASLAQPASKMTRTAYAECKRYHKLKSFKGEHAVENAYQVGQWVHGVIFGDDEAKQWCRDNGVIVTRAQSEGINSAGGFLVPTPMMNAIIDLREQFGVFRRYAQVVPMSSDTLQWPRRTGGLTANFIGEAAVVTESSATWDNINLTAKKLGVLTRISTELNEDALISVADLITNEIAYAFASKEDDCGFNGTGSSDYGGIRGINVLMIDGTHNAGKVAAASGHPTFNLIDATDITKLMGTLPQYALPRAAFYTSSLGFGTCFERLVATAGGNSIATLDGAIQYRYLGFPIVISQKMPVMANGVVGILFGDLALAAAIGERRVASIRRSEERYFDQDQIGILGTERVDIVAHDLGDNTTAGPIVALVGTT